MRAWVGGWLDGPHVHHLKTIFTHPPTHPPTHPRPSASPCKAGSSSSSTPPPTQEEEEEEEIEEMEEDTHVSISPTQPLSFPSTKQTAPSA